MEAMFKLRQSVPKIQDPVISTATPENATTTTATTTHENELKWQGGMIQFENVKFNYPKSNIIEKNTATTASTTSTTTNNNSVDNSNKKMSNMTGKGEKDNNTIETREILNNVNMTIPAGSTVAIVGSSGSGKSTIMRLLYRFYDPIEGNIYIDHQNIKKVTLYSLRKHMAVVPQDTILFNESLKYNIAYGNLALYKKDPSIVEKVAKEAQLVSLIQRLPQGYDTLVGERG